MATSLKKVGICGTFVVHINRFFLVCYFPLCTKAQLYNLLRDTLYKECR